MEWKEQYKHPNWQRKRLEALDGAGFACERCCSQDKQLHVHHKRYVKGRKIWEYELSELEVLCDDCHESAHAFKDAIQFLLATIPTDSLPVVIGLLAGFYGELPDCNAFDTPSSFDVEYARRVGEAARAIHDRMLGDEALSLAAAIRSHVRLKGENTTLTLILGPAIGFMND